MALTPHIFEFDHDKNQWLRDERGISFEDIIVLIEAGYLLEVLPHHNQEQYAGQYILEIAVEEYVYCVPCLMEADRIVLKTIFPSRKATRKYQKDRER